MRITRRCPGHWYVDSPGLAWITDAEVDLAKFAGPVAVSFSAHLTTAYAETMAVEMGTGGAAEQVGGTTLARVEQAGPFTGFVTGANLARVDPAQGKILLHLSASIGAGYFDLEDVTLTITDE